MESFYRPLLVVYHFVEVCVVQLKNFGGKIEVYVHRAHFLEVAYVEVSYHVVVGNSVVSDFVHVLYPPPRLSEVKITRVCKVAKKRVLLALNDGIVGGQYLYLLGKRPIDQLNVVEFGYINQFMTPMKPNSKLAKAQCLHGQTPMRYGEDEVANLTSVIGAEATARITGIYSNSPVAIGKLNQCLLTHPNPTALPNIGMTTKEVIETSSNIAMFKHQFAETGFILKEVEVEVPDVE